MIQKSFEDNAMNVAQMKMWHKCFKDGQESVERDQHSGRPATSRTPEKVECVEVAINKDPMVPTLKGTEVPLAYAQSFLYLLHQIYLVFIVHGWILSEQTISIYLSLYISLVSTF